MRSAIIAAVAAIVVAGPPDGVRAQEPSFTPILLRPTDHPRVPQSLYSCTAPLIWDLVV